MRISPLIEGYLEAGRSNDAGGAKYNILEPNILGMQNVSESLIALIRGYMEMGGTQLQFNVVSAETLRAAQEKPHQYGDLLVRIGGDSDYFVRLPLDLQNEILSRSENVM